MICAEKNKLVHISGETDEQILEEFIAIARAIKTMYSQDELDTALIIAQMKSKLERMENDDIDGITENLG